MSKFQLQHCPNGGINCERLVTQMNDLFANANDAIASKDYVRAFKLESTAFNETFTLENDSCKKCAAMFRNVIMESVGEHIGDLRTMTTGLFGRKSYVPLLQRAEALLKEMEQSHREAEYEISTLVAEIKHQNLRHLSR